MQASYEELQGMRRNLSRRQQQRSTRVQQRLRQARIDFANIVQHIIDRYHPVRIYQWGSLIDASHFSERSDIDVAVEGILDAREFFALLRDAAAMTELPVDVVQLETIHPVYAESIRSRGKIIYEQ